jgi:hypothetical protein
MNLAQLAKLRRGINLDPICKKESGPTVKKKYNKREN